MRRLPLLALTLAVWACDANDDGRADDGEPGRSADTAIVERTTQDTTIVTRDTMVQVDTTVRRGTNTMDRDTLRDD